MPFLASLLVALLFSLPVRAQNFAKRLPKANLRKLAKSENIFRPEETFSFGRVYYDTVDVARLAQGGPIPTTTEDLWEFLDAVRADNENRRRRALQFSISGTNTFSSSSYFSQIVYLNFTSAEPTFSVFVRDLRPVAPDSTETRPDFSVTFDSYSFTEEDMHSILERVEDDFDPFRRAFHFTLEEPDPTIEFSTVSFSTPSSFVRYGSGSEGSAIRATIRPNGSVDLDILFGQADDIDFRNQNRNDNIFLEPNFWTAIPLIFDGVPELAFSFFSGIEVDEETTLAEGIRQATVNQVANTVSHEVGHILGLRHHDSIGDQDGESAFESFEIFDGFVDVTPVDQFETETFLHLMASQASIGLPLQDCSTSDRYFSPRSAIKLQLGTIRGRFVVQSETFAELRGGEIGSRRPGFRLKTLVVPNTILEGDLQGRYLLASATVIEGSIETEDDEDNFRVRFNKGEIVSAEVVSVSGTTANPVITGLAISTEEEDGSLSPLFISYQQFEGFDPLILDFEIPETGTYVLTVFPQLFVCLNASVDDANCVALTGNNEVFNSGDYELLVYTIDRAI